jgi:hypothetical protein
MKIEEIKKLNIYEKLQKITDELGVVEKGLKIEVTKTRSYKAVSERDILDNVKPLETKYRVYSYPYERNIIDKDILVSHTEYGDKTNMYMRLETTYRFVNLDNSSEFVDIKTYGDGIDSGDKAPGKAMTYADKYALMKAYKISTGDDPDKEASPENGYMKEQMNLLGEIKKLMNTKKVLPNEISENFNKKSNEMNTEELQEVIKWLKEK